MSWLGYRSHLYVCTPGTYSYRYSVQHSVHIKTGDHDTFFVHFFFGQRRELHQTKSSLLIQQSGVHEAYLEANKARRGYAGVLDEINTDAPARRNGEGDAEAHINTYMHACVLTRACDYIQ